MVDKSAQNKQIDSVTDNVKDQNISISGDH